MGKVTIVIGVIAESHNGNNKCQKTSPFFAETGGYDVKKKEYKKSKCKPIASFCGSKSAKEQWWRCQEK